MISTQKRDTFSLKFELLSSNIWLTKLGLHKIEATQNRDA